MILSALLGYGYTPPAPQQPAASSQGQSQAQTQPGGGAVAPVPPAAPAANGAGAGNRGQDGAGGQNGNAATAQVNAATAALGEAAAAASGQSAAGAEPASGGSLRTLESYAAFRAPAPTASLRLDVPAGADGDIESSRRLAIKAQEQFLSARLVEGIGTRVDPLETVAAKVRTDEAQRGYVAANTDAAMSEIGRGLSRVV
ncbi:hypothetical protein [Roseivivax isoporae]|uniref:hypothetical protein n=1 Tax=Roseivivax isoporae TaxID=591206 RepID=UPI0004B21B4D|nr:hypothetical protein [Roseivivax isoporae]